MKIMTLFLLLSLSSISCGTTGQVYRYKDNVSEQIYELKLNKEGALSYKDKDIEIQMDSRKPTAWERFIAPVVSRTVKEGIN